MAESTADAIVSAVDAMYTEHTFAEKDFALKHNEDEISVDTNFAAQNFWKEALIRFFNKKSAVLGLVLIVVIVLLAVFGPGMNSYTYSGQDLSQKNFAPRVPNAFCNSLFSTARASCNLSLRLRDSS